MAGSIHGANVVFGKIETKFWDSLSVRGLNDPCKLAFVYLLANKHGTVPGSLGYYVLPLSYMADDLEWSVDKAEKTIKELERRGIVAYDSPTRIIWIINYLQYHTIKKTQTEISALALLQGLPLSGLAKGLYAAVKREYPEMKFCSYLESLVSDSSLFGNEPVTKRIRSGVPSISTSKSTSTSESKDSSYSSDFEDFWIVWKELKRAINKVGAFEAWQTTLHGRNGDSGHPPMVASALILAARNYQQACEVDETKPKFVMHPATFLGPKRRWEDYREPPERPKSNTEVLQEWMKRRHDGNQESSSDSE